MTVDLEQALSIAATCAAQVHPSTTVALIRVESGLNPWAIGVVDGALARQPRSRAEAVSTVRALRASGWNFSVGLAQINQANFGRLGLSAESAFDPCANLRAMQTVLLECQDRALRRSTTAPRPQPTLHQTLSCYYSGNFTTGFRHGYVGRVVNAAAGPSLVRP